MHTIILMVTDISWSYNRVKTFKSRLTDFGYVKMFLESGISREGINKNLELGLS